MDEEETEAGNANSLEVTFHNVHAAVECSR